MTEKASDPKKLVEQGYDRVAAEYAQLEQGESWPRMRWLRKILERLAPGSSVLDLGCGSGDPADVEIAKNHRLTGVDISRVQIDQARRNVPDGRFIHADAATVQFTSAPFDSIVSFYTLEHIPREQHLALMQKFSQWLRPDGFVLISTEASEIDGVGEWLGVPMYFSSFGADAAKELIVEAGFEVLESSIETQWEGGEAIPSLHFKKAGQFWPARHRPPIHAW